MAASKGEINTMARLIQGGVHVDCEDKNKFSALHYAGGAGQLSTIRALVNLGANTKKQDAFGRTPAEYARTMGKYDAYALLESLSES
mmetsp:Transcript_28613/g.44826  ORF Transcript_28613/g.44826 Transcript_28613/m.44826 type:complete len:87 (+) Transcript_28613:1394-1654(+)